MVITAKIIVKIRDMVLADRRVKLRETMGPISISLGTRVSILNDHLGITKLSSRWMSRFLSLINKLNRLEAS